MLTAQAEVNAVVMRTFLTASVHILEPSFQLHRPRPLPWKSGSRRFNSQPSLGGDRSELPHLIAFNPLPLLAAVSRDTREIRGKSDLRFARQQIKSGTCGYLTVVTCDAELAGSCKLFLHLDRVVPHGETLIGF